MRFTLSGEVGGGGGPQHFQRGRSVGGGPQIILFWPSHPLLHLEFFKSFWIKWKNLVGKGENEAGPKAKTFFFFF